VLDCHIVWLASKAPLLMLGRLCSRHPSTICTPVTVWGCRHIDGTWRSADEVPRTAEGRPQSFVAINGHGSYPYPGTTIRLFGAFNDQTSQKGELCTFLQPSPCTGASETWQLMWGGPPPPPGLSPLAWHRVG